MAHLNICGNQGRWPRFKRCYSVLLALQELLRMEAYFCHMHKKTCFGKSIMR